MLSTHPLVLNSEHSPASISPKESEVSIRIAFRQSSFAALRKEATV